jgi:transcriptional regulator with XRE-family HTH domain
MPRTPKNAGPRPASPLGERIRSLRETRGWTQTELAERAGLSQVHVSFIETGKRLALAHETVAALADALGVTSDDLEGNTPTIEPALQAFLDSAARPDDITPDEIERLARARVVLGPRATVQTYAALLAVMRSVR